MWDNYRPSKCNAEVSTLYSKLSGARSNTVRYAAYKTEHKLHPNTEKAKNYLTYVMKWENTGNSYDTKLLT